VKALRLGLYGAVFILVLATAVPVGHHILRAKVARATALGDLHSVRLALTLDPFLANTTPPDATCRDSLLSIAVEEGHHEIAELLIRRGARVDDRGAYQETPLHKAARRGDPYMVDVLLRKGAEPDARSQGGHTPLHYAAEAGDAQSVRLLLKHRVDLRAVTYDGRTPWHYAVLGGHRDAAGILREAGAGEPPGIHDAASFGDFERVRLEAKRDPGAVNSRDRRGLSPLHYAALHDHRDVAEFLLVHGADANALWDGRTPLLLATTEDSLPMVGLLVSQGADVNRADAYGETPLQNAVAAGNLEMVSYLVSRGADINQTGPRTALGLAVGHRNVGVIRYLIDHGADVHLRDEYGRTPLEIADERGYKDIGRLLR
jgi:ankyrin repeat protein